MPTITITFNSPLNTSLQVGDTAYYVPTVGQSGFDVNSSNIIEIGGITNLNQISNTISCSSILLPAAYPKPGDFILFTKDNKANLSSILGYYAEVTIKNNSKEKAELFAVSADYSESSK